ncbi:hypothetical protein CLCR_05303 [Cladophialophora carrionii]|uniref:Uncharacterized protein n=1 Tax=Cladophialophora carrionii TaxID=86049 RepID=A0A1C1CJU0_9EURO|nr:hypothetical protein CLCR_05303 [Cladophialophora carrionii]
MEGSPFAAVLAIRAGHPQHRHIDEKSRAPGRAEKWWIAFLQRPEAMASLATAELGAQRGPFAPGSLTRAAALNGPDGVNGRFT